MQVLTSRLMSGDPEDLIAYSVRAAKVIGSPGYPPDEERLQRRVRSDFERGWYPGRRAPDGGDRRRWRPTADAEVDRRCRRW